MKFSSIASIGIMLALVGCAPKVVVASKADQWWSFKKVGVEGEMIDTPMPPRDTVFCLKPDGTYSSQGFFGNGTWRDESTGMSLVADKWLVPARAPYSGFRVALEPGDPKTSPIRLDKNGDRLRMPLFLPNNSKKFWYEFKPYQPSKEEIRSGPKPTPILNPSPKDTLTKSDRAYANAIMIGDIKTIRRKLKEGADPSGPPRYMKQFAGIEVSAMGLAAMTRQAGSTEVLLEAGADPNLTSPGGLTPLMIAARAGSLECVQLLLKHGADRRKTTRIGSTAATYAIQGQNKEVIRLLPR